jgi:hypothetical protein
VTLASFDAKLAGISDNKYARIMVVNVDTSNAPADATGVRCVATAFQTNQPVPVTWTDPTTGVSSVQLACKQHGQVPCPAAGEFYVLVMCK